MQTGSDALITGLAEAGIQMVYANPGTSEMQMVAALDRQTRIRAVLCLFEGVCTGAADGHARMAATPAATLLHLGPGLANGLANLHNARKAGSPVVNLVGDHATEHLRYDAPLTSDLDGMARTVSHWLGRVSTPDQARVLAHEAVQQSLVDGGRIATLVVPADVAWGAATPANVEHAVGPTTRRDAIDSDACERAAAALRQHGASAMLLIGREALRTEGSVRLAQAIVEATGCRLAAPVTSARMERGGGLPFLPRIPFAVDDALRFLADVRCLVRVGAPTPIAFFAYPERPSRLLPDACAEHALGHSGDDAALVLAQLAAAVQVRPTGRMPPALVAPPSGPAPDDGALSREQLAAAIAATLPEQAIVVDESITSGLHIYPATAACPRHTWINNMGGSIGYGLPVALGAALACPDRPVLALVGDGSAFYTEQALWTMARENAHVTVVIFANRSYAILQGEWRKTRSGQASERARDLLSLERPAADWCAIARGHGVPAQRVNTGLELAHALRRAYKEPGPKLVEAWM